MTPIHELLARIRHDPVFGGAAFELGYVDRFDPGVQRVALGLITFPEREKRTFEFVDVLPRKLGFDSDRTPLCVQGVRHRAKVVVP
jgi:hypothetical protein